MQYATLTILLLIGLALLFGGLLIGGSRRSPRSAVCPHCSHENPRAAHYCGACGRELR